MKKADFLIVAVIALISFTFLLVFLFLDGGKSVLITQNDEIIYEVSLFEENTLDLGGNTVVIENGKVFVLKADCKNQICVNHSAISKKGESIVCLPNKVIVEIK